MDLFKKARNHVKVAIKEIHGVVQQGGQQQLHLQPAPVQGQYQHGQGHYYYPHEQPQPQQYEQQYQQQQQQYHQHAYGAPPSQGPQYNQYEQPPYQHSQYQPPQHQTGYTYSPPSPLPQASAPPAAPVQVREQPPSSHPHHNISAQPQDSEDSGKCLATDFVPIESNPFYTVHPQLRAGAQLEEVDFTLCANCYASLVSPYPQAAANFVLVAKPTVDAGSASLVSGRSAICHAITPRTRHALRQYVSGGSMQPIVDYVRLIKSLEACDGSPVPSTQGAWVPHGADGIGICTSCYEQFVRYTAFEQSFRYTTGELGDWCCDIGSEGVVSRVMADELLSTNPDYGRFTSIACKWLSAPACPGEGVPLQNGGSGSAYVALNGYTGVFCHACYWEYLAATPFENLAKETTLSESEMATIPCNLASPFAKFALKKAIARGDFKVWGKAATLSGKLPPCEGIKGVDETTLREPESFSWYKLKEHPSIEVCPSCYHTCLEVFGLKGLFEPIDRALVDGFVRQCFMPLDMGHTGTALDDLDSFPNTMVWRGRLIRDGIAFFFSSHGDLSLFQSNTEKVARAPPPCFSNSRACFPVNQRRWFGRSAQPDVPGDFHFTVCEECFVNCVQGTSLEHVLNCDATAAVNRQELGFVCQAYSSRTRKVLKEAMASGNWEHFAEHWRRRDEVRARYHAAKEREAKQMQKILLLKAQVDHEGAMARINLMQSLTASTNATIMGIGGSVAEASATDYGQRYGSSGVGYGYLTHNGARAAMNQQQAQEFAASMPVKDMRLYQDSGDTISDCYVVGAIVEEVTKEWQAIE